MFGKLMKAEWRASRRIIGALCAVVLISGALTQAQRAPNPHGSGRRTGQRTVRGTHCNAGASAPENVPPHRKGNELV